MKLRVGIVPHPDKPAAGSLGAVLARLLTQRQAQVFWDEPAGDLKPENEDWIVTDVSRVGADVLISLGGDGSLLRLARRVAKPEVPILGVNVGHIGFLTEVGEEGIEAAVDALVGGRFSLESRMMLSVVVRREGRIISEFLALNDVVITRRTLARMIKLHVRISGELAFSILADGVIVATPTGSTAYSLSAGGPVVHPELDCMIITPICPVALQGRSIVAQPRENVRIEMNAFHDEIAMTIDGQEDFALSAADVIDVSRAPTRCRLVRLTGRGFYQITREHLARPQI